MNEGSNAAVCSQYFGTKSADVPFPSGGDQSEKHQSTQALALPLIEHDDRGFGDVGFIDVADKACHRNTSLPTLGRWAYRPESKVVFPVYFSQIP